MPVIKQKGTTRMQSNFFHLFGDKETGLTKAFAYVLSTNRKLLFKFLREMGIIVNNTDDNFKAITIETEKVHHEHGRTDIEIKLDGRFHLIIEAKVGTNKEITQRYRYPEILLKSDETVRVLCFITQTNEHWFASGEEGIAVKNINWILIDELTDDQEIIQDQTTYRFLQYLRRFFTMKTQKEILIQDLGYGKEIDKYRSCNLYRREVIYGSPLYFCPYFTREANQLEGEGASYISRVLGILSFRLSAIDNPHAIIEELNSFCSDYEEDRKAALIGKWTKGIAEYIDEEKSSRDETNEEKSYSFYFLDDPIKLPGKAMKDPKNSKGWIGTNIPANRCVSFTALLTHMKFD